MTSKSRILLIAMAAMLVSAATCLAATTRVRAVNIDLQMKQVNTQQVRAALLYLQPDVVGLQSVREVTPAGQPAAGAGSVAALARSLRMYYVYEPAFEGADYGTALLSRFPISKPAPLSAPTVGKVPGLRADLKVGTKSLRVALVRPRDAEQAKAGAAAISRMMKVSPKQHLLLLATLEAAGAMDTIKAWGRAGLQDAAVALKSARPTFPAANPKDRLDYALVTSNLRPGLKAVQLVKDAKLRSVTDHLPLDVMLVY